MHITGINVHYAGTSYLGTSIATAIYDQTDSLVISPGPSAASTSFFFNQNAPGVSASNSFAIPGASNAGGENADASTRASASNNNRFDEIIPDENALADAEVQNALSKDERNASGPNPLLIDSAAGQIVVFSGGRGVAQLADLGRGSSFSPPPNVFDQEKEGDCKSDGGYFKNSAFGASHSGCGK